jgi:cob(I)alamin adenosyltransferase
MDPFSAAASGIAVVSLAIQLVDSVREIQRFLRNVSEAPKELKRLLDLLEHLELILENIGAQMAKQQRNSIDLDDTTITSVQKAMKMCEDKLLVLEGFVKRAKKASEARNKATRAVGAFKLACKKKDIEEFESQLQQAIHVLNLTMTINLT